MSKPNFERLSLKERQEEALKLMEESRSSLRDALAIILDTEAGKKVFRYLFMLTGAGNSSYVFEQDGRYSIEKSLIMSGRQDVYNQIRTNLDSKTIVEIERPEWEAQSKK